MAIEARQEFGFGPVKSKRRYPIEPSGKEFLVRMATGYARHWMQVTGPDDIRLCSADPAITPELSFHADEINVLGLRAVSMLPSYMLTIRYEWVGPETLTGYDEN